jgi:ribosomal protein S18 acetylase RimI-like enzyme
MPIEELTAATAEAELPALAGLLAACVAAGASVNFLQPFPPQDAAAWWRAKVLPALARGERRVLVARVGGAIIGTAQLDLATPPNQAHRADVSKVLVHPQARRRGAARALMLALEAIAAEEGRTLLTLDTVTGSPAEHLYRGLGYTLAGVIPDYALAADRSGLDSTSLFWKRIPAG